MRFTNSLIHISVICLLIVVSPVNLYGEEVFKAINESSEKNRQFFLPLRLDALFPKDMTSKKAAKRITPQKPSHTKVEEGIHHKDLIIVKFAEGTGIRLRRGQLVSLKNSMDRVMLRRQMLTLKRILKQHKVKKIERLFSSTEQELDWMKDKGKRLSGKELANLNLYYLFSINPKITDPEKLIDALNRLEIVEIAYPEPKTNAVDFAVPSSAALGQTLKQGYITDIEADYAWNSEKIYGQGVGVYHIGDYLNVDYWNLSHEDLQESGKPVAAVIQGKTYGTDGHDTAVIGIIKALDNGIGVRGIAHKADMGLFSTFTGADISNSTTYSKPGDVILLTSGPSLDRIHRDAVPWEYTVKGENENNGKSFFDLIQAATAIGRIVIEAAGNDEGGDGINLDDPKYTWDPLEPHPDSGAIIVGAGKPAGEGAHSRIVNSPIPNTTPTLSWSSNYGSLVKVQGWGKDVATIGGQNYCEIKYGDDINRCYTYFGGTSAAAPIVAGAAALVQSYALNKLGIPLNPAFMRQLLEVSGNEVSPQTGDTTKPIGPLVNVRAAIERLDAAQRPVPDLKGNDIDTGLTVTAGENVDITLSLDPRGFNDFKADWWIVAYVKDVDTWYYCNFLNNTCQWDINPTASSQGLLYNINSAHIYNGPLPEDFKDITLYFMVDLNPNGIKDVPYYLDCLNIKVVSPTMTPPMPDIKVNGSDGSIVIAPNTSIELTVSLDSGSYAGDNADWWLVANIVNSGLWYYYNYNSGEWIQSDIGGLRPAYQGPIEDLPAYTVYNDVLPPELNHVFVYSGVDLSMNGQLDLDLSYYDYVQVRVE